nr:hypothetical protein [Ruminococcus sp.]
MKLKDKFCNYLNGLVDSRLNNTKKVTTSYVALFLVLSIFTVTTFSWFTIRDTATIDSDPFTLDSAAGMRVNKGEEIRNTITVQNAKLKEASSVDGRNMFFPVDRGYGDKGQSVDTSEMKFREGTVGDKNNGYIYSDFTLTGQTGGKVEVYVKNYKVEVKNKNTGENEVYDGATHITVDGNKKPLTYLAYQNPCPIRIAFIRNSAEASTLIDPTAIIDNYADECQAVSSVNSLGSATTAKAKGRSFSDYYFGTGAPLFTLDGLKSQNITMVAWLEATGENCDAYEGQDVSITVELESNWKDMEYVTFVDNTIGDVDATQSKWVGKDECFLVMTYYDDNFENPKSVVMSASKSDGNKPIEWIAYLPKDKKTNISFMRYSKAKEKIVLDGTNEVEVGRIYNVWHTTADVNAWIDANSATEAGKKAQDWSHEINKEHGLQTYRTDDGTENGKIENTYYAVHGNGYGSTTTVAENVAPCIGYWGTKYPNSSGGSVEPTTTEQLPTTGETYARADIQIYNNVWLNDYNSYNGGGGLRNLLSQNVLVLKAVFKDSNGTESAYEMKPQGGGDKCVLSKTSVKSGSTLVRFDLYDPAKENPIIRKYLVTENIQHTFTESAGSNEYIISYDLVNEGSGKIIKAGEW